MPKKSTHPEHEGDVYGKEGLQELREDDEIEDWEEGFMEGARGMGAKANCAYCDKPLPAKSKVVEKEIDDERFLFCSSRCAGKGPR